MDLLLHSTVGLVTTFTKYFFRKGKRSSPIKVDILLTHNMHLVTPIRDM